MAEISFNELLIMKMITITIEYSLKNILYIAIDECAHAHAQSSDRLPM